MDILSLSKQKSRTLLFIGMFIMFSLVSVILIIYFVGTKLQSVALASVGVLITRYTVSRCPSSSLFALN